MLTPLFEEKTLLNLVLCARDSTKPLIDQLVKTGEELNIGDSYEYRSYYQSLLDINTEKYFENGVLELVIYKVIKVARNKSKDCLNVKLQLT
ncbi:hypothetical protein ASG21_04305 [Chryseobacterium sp. Leaf394]|nr:hypothetical protein ASG21_04305 [Chryseobacterium sp. Leaf394]